MTPRHVLLTLVMAAGLQVPAERPCALVADTSELLRAAPDLPHPTALALASADDARVRAYLESIGTDAARETWYVLDRAMDSTWARGPDADQATLRPAFLRLSDGIAATFGCRDYAADAHERAAMANDANRETVRLRARIPVIAHSPQSPASRARLFGALAEDFVRTGSRRGALDARAGRRAEWIRAGLLDSVDASLRADLADSRAIGLDFRTCLLFGDQGSRQHTRGDFDSALASYDSALAIAHRCRLPDQAARILMFTARHEANVGHLARATELSLDALEACRAYRSRSAELATLVRAAGLFAEIGCWDIVEAYLARIPALGRSFDTEVWREVNAGWLRFAERERARLLFARGEVTAGHQAFQRLEPAARTPAAPVPYAALLDEWTRLLLDAGEAATARPLLERGVAFCDSFQVPEHGVPMALGLARALLALGDIEGAHAALTRYDRGRRTRPGGTYERIEAEVVRARWMDAVGRRGQAAAHLRATFDSVRTVVARLEPGAQGYLALARFESLREAMHAIAMRDPASGYRFELAWRALAARLARAEASGRGDAPLRPLAPGALHCVYWCRGPDVVRWVATATGVDRDTIAWTRFEGDRRTRRLIDLLGVAASGDEQHDDELARTLRDFGRTLLPSARLEAMAEHGRPTVYVSADGPLASVPFDALDIAADGAPVPLGRMADVASLRPGLAVAARMADGPPSVLIDPAIAPEASRRYPGLVRLDGAADRGIALARWPSAHVLEGDRAVRDAVLSAWRHAPAIYVGAHLIRLPEIPFVAFLPTAPASAPIHERAPQIEQADVQALDLSGCAQVMLAACASGARYSGASAGGPSFAEVFVDAGAHAAVQTAWPLADADARRFAAALLPRWSAGRDGAVREFNAARRSWIASGAGRASDWAAWTIVVRDFDRGRPAARAAGAVARAPRTSRSRTGPSRPRRRSQSRATRDRFRWRRARPASRA